MNLYASNEPAPVVICVRDEQYMEPRLRAAQEISRMEGSPLVLLSVCSPALSPEETAAWVERMQRAARASGAELHVIFDRRPVIAAAAWLRERGASCVITGRPGADSNGFVSGLRRLLNASAASQPGCSVLFCPARTAERRSVG